MDLSSFLSHLHSSCYSTFLLLTTYLDNTALKSLRLCIPSISPHLFPSLFRRIYFSSHPTDLNIFKHLANANDPSLSNLTRHIPTSLLWDDTSFDLWITGLQTYTDRLTQITPLPTHKLQSSSAQISAAYRFWTSEAAFFSSNRQYNIDAQTFQSCISQFPNLRHITILSRSRLTYVDPSAYWQIWQTPRTRAWRATPFHAHLLQPEPFKPSIGTTVHSSEGLRPLRIIISTARTTPHALQIGGLVIQSIGSGQTRATGSMNYNRYERKWNFDLHALTATRPTSIAKGKVVLNLLIETQTEDLFRHDSLWMQVLDELLDVGSETMEEITVSNVCLDWFYEYAVNHPGQMLERCKTLRRVNLEGGWCQNIAELLHYLHSLGVSEVSVSGVDVESVSWFEVLQTLRRSHTAFSFFEVKASRCPSDFYPWQVDSSWAAPWSGESKDITSWLRDESTTFPLVQGPG